MIRTYLMVGLAGLAAAFLAAGVARADMGSVYVSKDGTTVSESAQQALILHNGTDEVLILGTELKASRPTPILRFIPFPSEPKVALAPRDVFARLGRIVAKYDLQYLVAFRTKGGAQPPRSEGVELRLSAKLGAHDLTIVKVTDAAAFRSWVNGYFAAHHMPQRTSYPEVEAIVADYVARGIDYFVLDAVDVGTDSRLVDPVAYSFRSDALYYPLKDTNTFGGEGEIDLFIVSPATLCLPGSNLMPGDPDMAAAPDGGSLDKCLGLDAKASTSVQLVPEEKDLAALYPPAADFFGKTPAFLQSIRYVGPFKFTHDVMVPMPAGVARAIGVSDVEYDGFAARFGSALSDNPACRQKPGQGPCKALFERYYFDAASNSCKSFFWGGCQGSVPFRTREDCEKACTPASK